MHRYRAAKIGQFPVQIYWMFTWFVYIITCSVRNTQYQRSSNISDKHPRQIERDNSSPQLPDTKYGTIFFNAWEQKLSNDRYGRYHLPFMSVI